MSELDSNINMSSKEQNEQIETTEFKSDLGDFTHVQDRIIRFGKSKVMIAYTSLIIIVFLCSLISLVAMLVTDFTATVSGQTINLNYIKILVIFVIFIAAIIPIAFSLVTYGSIKTKKTYIIQGVKIINMYQTFIKVVLWISVAVTVVGTVVLLVRSFLLAIVFAALCGVTIYVFLSFVNKTQTFLNSVEWTFRKNDTLSNSYPTARYLKPYLIAFLVITLINFINKLASPSTYFTQYQFYTSQLTQSLNGIEIFSSIVQITGVVCMIYIVNTFDSFIRKGKATKQISVYDRIDS